jgi:hypothetical protein
MADTEEPQKGKIMQWVLILLGVAVAGYVLYSFFAVRRDVDAQMKRVRAAKEEKAALKSLTDKENVSEN